MEQKSDKEIKPYPADCKHEGQWKALGQMSMSPVVNPQTGQMIGGNLMVISSLYCEKCSQVKFNVTNIKLPSPEKPPGIVQPNVIIPGLDPRKRDS